MEAVHRGEFRHPFQSFRGTTLRREHNLYNAFGSIITSTGGTANPFRYIGRLGYYYDADLVEYYLRVRSYNGALARFISPDPSDLGSGISRYHYVRNSPLNFVDPFGLFMTDAHVLLTEASVAVAVKRAGIARACGDYIRNVVVCCNLAQDWGPNFYNLEMHFNRKNLVNETAAQREAS